MIPLYLVLMGILILPLSSIVNSEVYKEFDGIITKEVIDLYNNSFIKPGLNQSDVYSNILMVYSVQATYEIMPVLNKFHTMAIHLWYWKSAIQFGVVCETVHDKGVLESELQTVYIPVRINIEFIEGTRTPKFGVSKVCGYHLDAEAAIKELQSWKEHWFYKTEYWNNKPKEDVDKYFWNQVAGYFPSKSISSLGFPTVELSDNEKYLPINYFFASLVEQSLKFHLEEPRLQQLVAEECKK